MKSIKLTHGEMYVHRKESVDFKKDFKNICQQLERLPKRMKKDEALKYYGDKLKKYFNN